MYESLCINGMMKTVHGIEHIWLCRNFQAGLSREIFVFSQNEHAPPDILKILLADPTRAWSGCSSLLGKLSMLLDLGSGHQWRGVLSSI